jgi:hypothetical protein
VSFKLAIDVGFFDPHTGDVVRPVDAFEVKQAIVQAGGRLPEQNHPEDASRQRLVAGFASRGRPILGILGTEYVILHPGGFLMLALGCGSNPAALAFLRWATSAGCSLWTDDGETTEQTLALLAEMEERFAALRAKASP